MPNYCDNYLNVSGKQKEVAKFLNNFATLNTNRDLVFSMNNIIPQPCSCDDKNFNWYNDWRLENWGCKWDIDQNVEVEDIYDQLIRINDPEEYCDIDIPYTTPWSPNLEFVQRASAAYNNLIFNIKYYEPGCELAGDFTYEGGDETENFMYDGKDLFEFYVWVIENDFEDADYVLNDMELEDFNKELYDKLNAYFNPSDEDVIDLSDVLLGNNLPEPQ